MISTRSRRGYSHMPMWLAELAACANKPSLWAWFFEPGLERIRRNPW